MRIISRLSHSLVAPVKAMVALALLAAPVLSADAAVNATVAFSDGKYRFTVTGVTTSDDIHLQLSQYPDFYKTISSTLAYKNSPTRTAAVTPSNIDEGQYYWRVRYVEGTAVRFFTPADNTPLSFTKPRAEVPEATDATVFAPATLADGTELTLTSVWMRSHNTSNPLYKSVDRPGHSNATDATFDHGFVIKGGVIYISRGSLGATGWESDRTRVWLERYDLLTGAEMAPLRVYAPKGEEYPSKQVMEWIRADDDGTVYFTTASLNNYQGIRLYTVDLDGVTADTEAVTATEALDVAHTETQSPELVTVSGSINSGDYRMWWAVDDLSNLAPDRDYRCPVWRFTVEGGRVTSRERSDITSVPFPEGERPGAIQGFTFKIYPVDDTRFYMHGHSNDDMAALPPALYRFEAGGECELLGHYGSRPDILAPSLTRVSGVAPLEVAGKSMLVLGTPTDKGSSVTVMGLDTPQSDISTHTALWRPGEATGFSTHRLQGCGAQYIPDANASTGGLLAVHVPNGGLGLYRVDTKSTVVGLADPAEPPVTARYADGALRACRPVTAPRVTDLAGRTVASAPGVTDTLPLPALAPGLYLLTSPELPAALKFIVP